MKWELTTIVFLTYEIVVIVFSVFRTAFKGCMYILSSIKLHIKNYARGLI